MLIEKGVVVPRLLKYLAVCDFTKLDMVDWLWESLGAAIKAPIGPKLTNLSAGFKSSLKEVKFPILKRRLESSSCLRPPGSCHEQIESSPFSGNSASKDIRLETALTVGQSASEPLVHIEQSRTKISKSSLINNRQKRSDPCTAHSQKVSIGTEVSPGEVNVIGTAEEQFV